MDTFGPAFIFNVAQSEKATSPKKKKARKNSKNKNEFWESTLKLANSGIHELEFLYRTDILYIVHVKMKYGDNLNLEQSLSPKKYDDSNKVLFEVEDECVLHFEFKRKDIDAIVIHEINVLVSDSEPSGVKSFFEKLVLQNLSKKGAKEKVEVYGEWSHLHQIQNWMIGSPRYSWKPTILGMDYHDSIENFTQPDYLNNPVISNSEINIDFRPSYLESDIPKELVIQREDLIKELCHNGTEGSSYNLIEYLDLSKLKSERNLEDKVKNYIKQYLNWLDLDYERAIWMDILALCDSKRGTLDTSPFSVLLSPFHPIRLGWMLLSQSELSKSLEEGTPCPVAGSLSPNSFPDSILLPSYKNETHYSRTAFLSLEGSSYSWGVFWNSERLSDLSNENKTKIFTDKFGIQIEGLDSGLSSSQIEHTISDVFKIKSGQTSLSVSVYSDSNETHNFNDGIKNWVGNNLGSPVTIDGKKTERDIWYGSTGKTLKVFDSRPLWQQPSSEELTDYSKETEFGLQWYDSDIAVSNNTDLTIVSQLSNQSPVTHFTEFKSVLFGEGISRARLRFPTVNNYNKLNYTESRTCQKPKHIKDSLGGILEQVCYFVEKEVFDAEKGSLSSIPKLSFINTQLESSDYCAVSSSVIDPTAFFDGKKSYLWDYDLPKYSIRQNNSGFYLLARKSNSVSAAVKNSLSVIKDIGDVDEDIVASILREISGRGIPTLKKLASGGANASGEIGMLIGMNILQGFDNEMKDIEVFPQKNSEKDEYNIVIPVDPFKYQLNSLYDRFKLDRKRPDLLVVNIKGNEDVEMSITPVEIKFRTSTMKKDDLKSAHAQCINILELFNILDLKAQTSRIWDVARGKLLTEMLSFGFSIYGRRIKSQDDRIKWTKLQQKVLALISEPSGVNYNTQGRLIVISDYSLTSLETVQGHTNDTLLLAFKDAVSLIKRDNLEQFIPLKVKLQDWALVDISKKKYSPEKENNVEPSEIDQMNTAEEALYKSNDQHTLDPESNQDEIDTKIVIANADPNNVGLKFVIGNREGALENIPQYFHPSNTNLNQINIGIVGDLGTGKTQLLKALLHNFSLDPSLNRGKAPKFLILDTKKDYGKSDSNADLLKIIGAKSIDAYNIPLNVFDIKGSKSKNPKTKKAFFFVDILGKIYSGIGPIQKTNLFKAIDIAFENKGYIEGMNFDSFISPTINDVFESYQELVKNPDTPYSIMDSIVRLNLFESDPEKTVSFNTYFDSSVVVDLSDIANMTDPLKLALVIFLNLYQEYMLTVKEQPYIGTSPQLRNIDSFILIDEAKLILDQDFAVLEDVLRKGRMFGIGVILSSQYTGDFKSNKFDYGQALATWFIHKVPNVTDKELSQIGISNSEGLANKVKQLPPHYCLYKSGENSHQIIKGIPYYQLLT
ncbi:hypothetical protein N9J65_03300 [Flavobacteriaceae bacterium]|nr:hypothetical protein [Flavobacteriaceae bacterium]